MSSKGEQVRQKSPAEFFSENQIIAGFDNPGKSLYTSIRELVENSLDAAEAIGVLPDIELEVLEYTEAQFNKQRGLCGRAGGRLDADLFRNPGEAKKIPKGGKGKANSAAAADDDDDDDVTNGDGKRGRGGSAGKVNCSLSSLVFASRLTETMSTAAYLLALLLLLSQFWL